MWKTKETLGVFNLNLPLLGQISKVRTVLKSSKQENFKSDLTFLIVFVSDLVMMLFAVWFGWISMNNIDINQIPLAPSNSKVTWWSLIWSTTILLVCLRFSSMQFLHILVSNKKKRYNVIVLQMYFFRFEICKKLGQGTYGKVQLGINKETGQRVSSHFFQLR